MLVVMYCLFLCLTWPCSKILLSLCLENSSPWSWEREEIQRLRDQLKAKHSTPALLEQLEEKTKEVERREQLLKSLSEETDVLKKQLSATTARLAELEGKANSLHLSQVLISLKPDFLKKIFLIQFVIIMKNGFVKTCLSNGETV